MYEKASMFKESIKTMKSVLEINRDNADALNYIGYTFADKGVKLDQAGKMIKKLLN